MSLREDLPAILAKDARYALSAYVFVFEALEFTRKRKMLGAAPPELTKSGIRAKRVVTHVTGRELCLGARDLALTQYGRLAKTVLEMWGVRSTSDLGEIVYGLIAAGELRKTKTDKRTDFDDVFDFEDAFVKEFTVSLDAMTD